MALRILKALHRVALHSQGTKRSLGKDTSPLENIMLGSRKGRHKHFLRAFAGLPVHHYAPWENSQSIFINIQVHWENQQLNTWEIIRVFLSLRKHFPRVANVEKFLNLSQDSQFSQALFWESFSTFSRQCLMHTSWWALRREGTSPRPHTGQENRITVHQSLSYQMPPPTECEILLSWHASLEPLSRKQLHFALEASKKDNNSKHKGN